MRRFAILFTALALVLSGLVFSPAQATAPVDGTYLCTTGVITTEITNIYTISTGEVTSNVSGKCTGAVTIPEGVTSIGNNAFDQAALTSITIPASVTSIGDFAFADATALASITIPASVTSIGAGTFLGASALTSITIPASVTSIGYLAFAGATNLTSFSVAADNSTFKAEAGVLFELSTATPPAPVAVIAYPPASDRDTYDIPASVTVIGDGAFAFANSLTSINIPASVTVIGDGAFAFANSLTSINIPASVTSIGTSAFQGNNLLTTVTFTEGSTLTSIGNAAFAFANSLTSITIPESVTSIGNAAFQYNFSLESVIFAQRSSGLTIGYLAFAFANSLTSIEIPATVTSIGSSAFIGSTNLNSFTVATGSSNYKADSGALFTINGSKLLAYPLANTGTAYEIPLAVTTIETGAFVGATNLTSFSVAAGKSTYKAEAGVLFKLSTDDTPVPETLVAYPVANTGTTYEIPSAVTTIEQGAFIGATNLTSFSVAAGNSTFKTVSGALFTIDGTILLAYPVANTGTTYEIPAGVTSIGDGAFYGAPNLTSMTIPTGVTSIGELAFGKTSLTSIEIPASATAIGYTAFVGATSLSTISFLGAIPGSMFMPTPVRAGYAFNGWYSDSNFTTKIGAGDFTYFVTAPITLYAKFTSTASPNTASPIAACRPGLVMRINFASDSSKVSKSNKKKLKKIENLLKASGCSNIKITGYTSQETSKPSAKNKSVRAKISLARAKSVESYLVKSLKVSGSYLVEGRSQKDPIASNKSEKTRTPNRRAEIWFY